MEDIEIKRGYEVLPDNKVRFGVRVINNGDFAISDVEVILDYSQSLFELESSKIEELGNIPPSIPRTAKFILKPLSCVHKEEIGATVRYRDHKWEKHTIDMRPKEVHCVCPFLKEKTITRKNFLKLFNEGYPAERGLNFENIQPEKVIKFITHTCKNRLYKVDEFSIENKKILYLAGDSLGEKAYYLLTAVIIEREGITQVLFQAKSDKEFGINGFLNEIVENLRHLVQSSSAAMEIGVIKREQVINIIDSVVQHTNFSDGEGSSLVKIEDGVARRINFGPSQEESKRKEAEEDLRRQQEENERLEREEQERLRKQQEEEAKRLQEIKRKEQEEADRRKKEQEDLRRQREEERKKREEQERKRKEEEERLKKEKEKLQKLQEESEEAKRKAKEEAERKSLKAARELQVVKQTIKPSTHQDPYLEKLSATPPKKSDRSSGKKILIFSLIFGILLIGVAYILLTSNPLSENVTTENVTTQIANNIQTESSENSDTYINSIGMEFVKIPEGEFMMGSSVNRYDNNLPTHKVTIGKSFYLGKFEVTQEQWSEVMGSNPSEFIDDLTQEQWGEVMGSNPSEFIDYGRPVECVSWEDAQEFVEKLNEMEGTDKYRLPSEAEWDYACNARTTTINKLIREDYAWYDGGSRMDLYYDVYSDAYRAHSGTYPVGQKKPNPWGLYDMYGNVWEWVQDRYHDDYNGAPSDGSAWERGNSPYRVTRGGSWSSDFWMCTFRYSFIPSYRYHNLGFRVLKEI